MSERQAVYIETLRVSAGALLEPELVLVALPGAIAHHLQRPAAVASDPVDQVASQVTTAIRSALAAEGIQR